MVKSGPKPRSPIERFMEKVERLDTGCWQWTAAAYADGYGAFHPGGGRNARPQQVRAHRWSYEHHKEPIPQGWEVHHLCFNTLCVNPEHLQAMRAAENREKSTSYMARMRRAVRCRRGHPFDDTNTRIEHIEGRAPRRQCMTCARERATKRKATPIDKDTPEYRRRMAKHLARTHCKHGHPFTEASRYFIHQDGLPVLTCQICRNESVKRHYAKSK